MSCRKGSWPHVIASMHMRDAQPRTAPEVPPAGWAVAPAQPALLIL
jgi:hypothetical protein